MRINPNRLIHGALLIAMASLTACGGGGGGGGSTVPATTTYTIGGSVTGLTGTVVLQNNGGDNLSVSANGAFTFATGLAGGATYSITVLTQPAGQICSVNPYSGTVSAANVTSVAVTCAAIANTYTVGGSVNGLTAAGLVLQNNGGDDLPISASGAFTFATRLASGATYTVTVKTQPAGQTCTVNPYTGTVSANVIVAVTCTTPTPLPTAFTVGGNVTGLAAGTGLVLREGVSGENLSITTNGIFNFVTQRQNGASYVVQVLTHPAGQTCSVINYLGSVSGANVTTISVTCSTPTYSIGGTISGLTGTGLVLQNNGGDALDVGASATTFTFSTPIANGSTYNVTVLTQPSGQTCSVNSGTGPVASANVTSVSVTCSDATYAVGVTVAGLTGTVVLQNNGGNNLTIGADGNYAFSTALPSGSGYSVSVLTQPTLPQICTAAPAVGQVGVATNVSVTCVNAYTIGGMIYGAADGVGPILQNNGGDNLFIPAITTTGTSFTFTTPIANGTSYSITQLVRARAPSQSCTATTNGSGTVAGANVDTVVITCSLSTITPSFAYVTNSTATPIGTADTVSAFTIGLGGNLAAATPATTASGDEPYAVSVDPTGQFTYVVNRNDDSVSVYSIGAGGALGTQSTIATGDAPMSIAIHPSGKFAYVANYMDTTAGNTLSAYSIDVTTGALSAIDADGVPGYQTSIATGANPYAVVIDPLGRFAYVANNSSNTLSAYSIDVTTGALSAIDADGAIVGSQLTVAAGTNPSSIAIDPTGKCALVVNNTSNDVMSYAIHQTTGALTWVSTVAGAGGSNPSSIAIDPSMGQYAYVANAGTDSVSALSITPSTCGIAAVNADGVTPALTIAAGATPISVNVDPSGQFVYVANYSSNSVSAYVIGVGGALTWLNDVATGAGPTSVTTTQ